jgi:hypothetical protein
MADFFLPAIGDATDKKAALEGGPFISASINGTPAR